MPMLTLIHVILALSALTLSVVANIKPSEAKLTSSYGLAMGTLASGALLIFVNDANMLRTCLTGIVFFGIVSLLNETARRKIATQEN